MKDLCLRQKRKLSWQLYPTFNPNETGRYAVSTDRKEPQPGKNCPSEDDLTPQSCKCCNLRGRDGVKASSQNNRRDHQLIPSWANSTNRDWDIFHCTAPAEACVDQMRRAPCFRAIWAYRPTISFYLSFCSASGLPSLLCRTAPVTMESLHWKVVIEIKCFFQIGFVAVL